jgi:hypothetical protein
MFCLLFTANVPATEFASFMPEEPTEKKRNNISQA